MDVSWKNRLQEYCQKHKISLPIYRVKNQSGPAHLLKFQVEVAVKNHWYVGDDLCSSKKDAEQSAAKKAWEMLVAKNISSPSTPQFSTTTTLQEYSNILESTSKNHLPDEYVTVEQFIAAKVKKYGGKIRTISPPSSLGQYKFEITDSYRYCENVQRHHKKNHIYFIVDPIKQTYFQKCHDPECYGFRSTIHSISDEQNTSPSTSENDSADRCTKCRTPFTHQNRNECERCGEMFCKQCVCLCELCHDAIHCDRCFDLCFDCHDS